jgi:2-methylcitrate dehydratase PrpD
VNKHNIRPENVQEVMITCPGQGALSIPLEVKAHPRNLVDSQFSIPWAVAVVIARKRAGIADFTEEAIVSRDILDIADKIKLDASGEAGPGAMTKSRVQITTCDGQTYFESAFGQAPGGPQSPLPFSVYENKFRDCASYSIKKLSDKKIDTVIQHVKNLEQLDDIRDIIRLLS